MENIIDNRNIYNNLNGNINTLNNDKLILKDENSSLLVLAIDLQQLLQFDEENDVSTIMKNIIVFINAHIAYSSSNKVCCIINDDRNGVEFLYPNEDEEDESTEVLNGDMYQGFKKVNESIMRKLAKVVEKHKEEVLGSSTSKKKRSSLAGVISCGLTYIHRILKDSISIRARMVVVTGQTLHSNIIQSHQYIPIMNCIFTAMKLKCPIDVLKINDININKNTAKSNSFLQQATDATNGIYLEINSTNGMIQYLTTIFYLNTVVTSTTIDNKLKINNSVDKLEIEINNEDNEDEDEEVIVTSHSDILLKPTTSQVDFRTSCFLTGKTVAVGFVCNVCLVVISYIPITLKDCPCCGSNFDIKALKKLKYWQQQESSSSKKGFIKKLSKTAMDQKNGGVGSSSATPIEL
ncbi:hypothetical protein QEN19_003777 [Hanseniaspora menglaensis]